MARDRWTSRLQAAMDARSLDRKGLAYALGYDRSTVDKWFARKRQPNLDTVRRVATILGVDPGYLAFGSVVRTETSPEEKKEQA